MKFIKCKKWRQRAIIVSSRKKRKRQCCLTGGASINIVKILEKRIKGFEGFNFVGENVKLNFY